MNSKGRLIKRMVRPLGERVFKDLHEQVGRKCIVVQNHRSGLPVGVRARQGGLWPVQRSSSGVSESRRSLRFSLHTCQGSGVVVVVVVAVIEGIRRALHCTVRKRHTMPGIPLPPVGLNQYILTTIASLNVTCEDYAEWTTGNLKR